MSRKKLLTYTFFLLLFAWLFSFCRTGNNSSTSATYANLQDSVKYVGMATCRSCHDNVHASYIQTGMGRSFHLATRKKSDAIFDDHALVYDTLNDFYYFPYFDKNEVLNVLEFRLEHGDTVHQRLEQISYIIGSGQHTNSHIIDNNGYIYQAPVTWYTQEKRWDLAPGFRENNSRFGRWLNDECLTCHNHFPKQIPGSLNKFTDMPTGIECERCHGPGEIHAKEMLAGNLIDTALAIDYSIITPSDLPRNLQMDLCQRCHLQGIAVTEPGKSFFDFKPGMQLNEVMNVFLPRYSNNHEKFIMASQADRLRLSACFKNDEKLTCLTCHHPHHSIEVTPKEQYNNACKSCHAEKMCTAPVAERNKNGDDCSACHMPKSGSTDIPHVRITDHLIAKPNSRPLSIQTSASRFLGIEILTKENPSPLDMAKGYLATFDKYIAAPIMLDSAAYYLEKSAVPFDQKLPTQFHYLFIKKDYEQIKTLAAQADPPQMDAWTAYRTGEAFFQLGDLSAALNFLNIATEKLPLHLDFLEKKGVIFLALKRIKEGKTIFEKVLAENPKRPVALCNLGFAHALTGNLLKAAQFYDQAIALDPDYEQALINKAALLAVQNKKEETQQLLLRVLRINPENRQALDAMRRLIGSN